MTATRLPCPPGRAPVRGSAAVVQGTRWESGAVPQLLSGNDPHPMATARKRAGRPRGVMIREPGDLFPAPYRGACPFGGRKDAWTWL